MPSGVSLTSMDAPSSRSRMRSASPYRPAVLALARNSRSVCTRGASRLSRICESRLGDLGQAHDQRPEFGPEQWVGCR